MPARSIARSRAKPSLTALIDVVFILLLFFMVATRFSEESILPLQTARDGGGSESPRAAFVEVAPEVIRIGGHPIDADALAERFAALAEAGTGLLLVPRDDVNMQRLVDVIDRAEAAGISHLTLESR